MPVWLQYLLMVKGRYSSSWGEPHLRATGRHLPQCYLPPDTSERAPPNPRHTGWYSIYLPRRDGMLSWPSSFDSAQAGSRTSDAQPLHHKVSYLMSNVICLLLLILWLQSLCVVQSIVRFMSVYVYNWQEEQMRGKAKWEHLNEDLHVLVTVEDAKNRATVKLKRAVEQVKKLLVPSVSFTQGC